MNKAKAKKIREIMIKWDGNMYTSAYSYSRNEKGEIIKQGYSRREGEVYATAQEVRIAMYEEVES